MLDIIETRADFLKHAVSRETHSIFADSNTSISAVKTNKNKSKINYVNVILFVTGKIPAKLHYHSVLPSLNVNRYDVYMILSKLFIVPSFN